MQTQEYISSHYRSRITLEEIAASLHVNRSYLCRIYKEKTGENIFDLIKKKKLDAAKQLIAHSDLRISDVARQVGFEDAAYFSRFFKKYTGMSPKEYELQTRTEQETLQ